eukprot:88805_1
MSFLLTYYLLAHSNLVKGFYPNPANTYNSGLIHDAHAPRGQVILQAQSDDSTPASRAVEDAVHMSEVYGAGSKEARVAWDIVEEIDANDSRKRAVQSTSHHQGHKAVYTNEMQRLSNQLKSLSSTLANIKSTVSILKQLENDDPAITKANKKISRQLANALVEARIADTVHGTTSTEASKAWDHVQLVSSRVPDVVANVLLDSEKNRYKESIVSSHRQFFSIVDSRSIDDALEAISSLEHFTR